MKTNYAHTLMIYCELAWQITRIFLEVQPTGTPVWGGETPSRGDETAFRPVPAESNHWLHPALTPARGWYSIYLPRRDGRLSWHMWPVTYRDGLPAQRSVSNLLSRQSWLHCCLFVVFASQISTINPFTDTCTRQ